MAKPTVVFLTAKCSKTGKTFYMREDLAADGMWVRTYGLTSLPVGNASGASSPAEIDYSNHRIGPQYKCPHCGNRLIFKCTDCGATACCHDGGDRWRCPVTGESGGFSSDSISSMSGSGGQGQK